LGSVGLRRLFIMNSSVNISFMKQQFVLALIFLIFVRPVLAGSGHDAPDAALATAVNEAPSIEGFYRGKRGLLAKECFVVIVKHSDGTIEIIVDPLDHKSTENSIIYGLASAYAPKLARDELQRAAQRGGGRLQIDRMVKFHNKLDNVWDAPVATSWILDFNRKGALTKAQSLRERTKRDTSCRDLVKTTQDTKGWVGDNKDQVVGNPKYTFTPKK
jgi:hypothetical protein